MLNLAPISFLLLILWQPVWFAWLAPVQTLPLPFVLAALMLPLAVCLPWVWRKRPKALVFGGCLLLFHFSLAVTELWAAPEARLAAGVQLLLVVAYYAGVTIGLRRHAARADQGRGSA